MVVMPTPRPCAWQVLYGNSLMGFVPAARGKQLAAGKKASHAETPRRAPGQQELLYIKSKEIAHVCSKTGSSPAGPEAGREQLCPRQHAAKVADLRPAAEVAVVQRRRAWGARDLQGPLRASTCAWERAAERGFGSVRGAAGVGGAPPGVDQRPPPKNPSAKMRK